MLSAFTPQAIVELKARDKSEIRCVLAHGDRILVGLGSGALRIYRVVEPAAPDHEIIDEETGRPPTRGNEKTPARSVELLDEREKFSRRAVQQLALIKEANILISLSDGYVSFYDLQTYVETEKLDRTKGATTFAATSNVVKDDSGIPSLVSRLAVAVKRKVLVWTWRDMELKGAAEELTLIGAVKSLTWASEGKIVAGMDPGFVMIDVEKLEVMDIHRPAAPQGTDTSSNAALRFGAVNSSGMSYVGMSNWVPDPLSTKLWNEELLLAKDVNSLFIDPNGKALDKRQIPWQSAPEAVAYSYPFLLSLRDAAKGVLEVRNPETLNLLQTISMPSATFVHVPQPYISLAHAGKGFLVASKRCIWRMNALGYESQIDELVEQHLFDEAISLVNLLEDTFLKDKRARLRDIKVLKAQNLFDDKRWRDSLDLFIEADAPPARVIALYPTTISGPTLKALREKVDARRKHTRNVSVEVDKITESGSTPRKKKKKIADDAASIRSVAITGAPTEGDGDDEGLSNKDLRPAVGELRSFLAQARVRINRYLDFEGRLKPGAISDTEKADPEHVDSGIRDLFDLDLSETPSNVVDWEQRLAETATLVDTTLFRAYMVISPSLVGPLLRLENFCSPEIVRGRLIENERYDDLIDFLQNKKRHAEALALLQSFGKEERKVTDKEAFVGPQKMIAYLQQLPPELIDVILEFAEWPMQTKPNLAMAIFIADNRNAALLPRNQVLDFLRKIDAKYAAQYLEHVIKELRDDSHDLHEELLGLYLKRINAFEAEQGESERGELLQMQVKLHDFLESSGLYNKDKTLKQLSKDDPRFYEARAIIHRKLSHHRQALQIYVFQMRDYARAEDYCNRVYSSIRSATATSAADQDNPDEQQSIYTTLLSLYLTPPAGQDRNLDAALDLLSRHGPRLPALSTLSVLPNALTINELESYFKGRMRLANTVGREEAIVAALSKVERENTEAALLFGQEASPADKDGVGKQGRDRRIVIEENTLCKSCNTRFGRAAVRVWPNGGDVVHYSCSAKRRR